MSKALEKLKQNAEEIALTSVRQNNDDAKKQSLLIALGAFSALGVVSKFVNSAIIAGLKKIRDEQQHEAFGYTRFDDFLDNDPLAKRFIGISYRTFNNLENQLEAEGKELYDFLNQLQIPITSRRLLTTGDGATEITLDGDRITIGKEEINLEDVPRIREIVRTIAKEQRTLADRQRSTDLKIQSLQDQLKTGASEYDELRRAQDAAREGTAYERALMKAVGALLAFAIEAKDTPLVEKAHRTEADMHVLWSQVQNVRTALHLDGFIFTEENPDAKDVSPLARQAIEETGDWDDENEQ